MIDADFKAGNSGSQADPNYVAPTAQGTGNIGFEWEVLLATGNSTTVTVYETDGKIGPDIAQKYQTTNASNWQISTALTTNSNNPDYFYDFYVPISVFTGTYPISGSTPFRFVRHATHDAYFVKFRFRSRCLYQSAGDHQQFGCYWFGPVNFRYLGAKG